MLTVFPRLFLPVLLAVQGADEGGSLDEELQFAVSLARTGYFDLAEARCLALCEGDPAASDAPLACVAAAIDGLAGVRLLRGLAARDEAAVAALGGTLDGAAVEAIRERARRALHGVHEAVERGFDLAAEAEPVGARDESELRDLVRFGLLRHAEASLELARLEPLGGLSRDLLAEAARDAAFELLWECGDDSAWSSGAYLLHGAACLEAARGKARDEREALEAEGRRSLAEVTGLHALLRRTAEEERARELAIAVRAAHEELSAALVAAARLADAGDEPAARAEREAARERLVGFRERCRAAGVEPADGASRLALEEARLFQSLGERDRAERAARDVVAGAADVRVIGEARHLLDRLAARETPPAAVGGVSRPHR